VRVSIGAGAGEWIESTGSVVIEGVLEELVAAVLEGVGVGVKGVGSLVGVLVDGVVLGVGVGGAGALVVGLYAYATAQSI